MGYAIYITHLHNSLAIRLSYCIPTYSTHLITPIGPIRHHHYNNSICYLPAQKLWILCDWRILPELINISRRRRRRRRRSMRRRMRRRRMRQSRRRSRRRTRSRNRRFIADLVKIKIIVIVTSWHSVWLG